METLLLTVHIVVCVLLVLLVLLQAGKEGMGVIFGGGGSSLFGSSGAGGILAKLTAFLAILFVISSISYNLMTKPATAADESLMKPKPLEFERSDKPGLLNVIPAPNATNSTSSTKGAPDSAKAPDAEGSAQSAKPAQSLDTHNSSKASGKESSPAPHSSKEKGTHTPKGNSPKNK